ncbi:MAG: T9SS type A sorting domain-containing protein [Candidatus Marinimicrobia bacterium]|nr:T9SS type A sorting domain-containing protein [Candidatus Neomarinimicrobiota bacterium]
MSLKKIIKHFIYLPLLMLPLMAQDVILDLGEVEVDGYTTDIVVPVTMENANHAIGGIQFDLNVSPAMISISGATPADGLEGFAVDYTHFGDGSSRVVMYNQSAPDGIPAGGTGIVLNLHFDGADILSAVLDLGINSIIVSGIGGEVLSSSGTGGSITIGDVVYLSASEATGDVGETVELSFSLTNSGNVGGVQFDLFDSPNYVDGISFSSTDRTAGFNIAFSEIESGVRVIVFSESNEEILPGDGAIVTGQFQIHDDAYADEVGLHYSNVLVTDGIGGNYWVASTDSGSITVYPGYIEEPHNLEAQSGMDQQVVLTWDAPYGPIPPEFTEDFEGGAIPEDWEMISNGNGWYVSQDGSSNFWTIPSHSSYAVSNDDGFNGEDTPDNDGNDFLIMPPINMTGAEEVILNFASYYDGAYGEIATIDVSTDGINFEPVGSIDPAAEWVMTSIDLSSMAGASTVYIAFHADDGGSWASGWAIDDVLMTFSNARVSSNIHFNLTDLGEWLITSDKNDVIAAYPSGVPANWKYDFENPLPSEFSDRTPEIDQYRVFRSVGDDQNYVMVDVVDGDVTTYTDIDVDNGVTYYYFVTAIYPSGAESLPTNTVSATPVEWVELSISNGAALSGQTDTLDIFVNNESDISLFYFEIQDYPDVINAYTILSTERTNGWSLDVVDLPSGALAITGISLSDPLTAGNESVCRVVVYPVADEELTSTLTFVNASLQDVNFVEMNWTSEPGTFDVTIETQYLTVTNGQGLPGGNTEISVLISNTQDVYGIQFDLINTPPLLTGVSFEASNAFDFSSWSISGDQIGNYFRVLMYDNTLQNPIPAGIYHLGEVIYTIHSATPLDQTLDITVNNITISDVNNIPMHTESNTSTIYVGQPPALYSIENVTGQLAPGGTGSFEVHLLNLEPVYVTEFTLMDLPDYLNISNIMLLDRFNNGVADGSSGETENGNYYFLGYEFNSGIVPGSGAVLSFDVTFPQNIETNSLLFVIENAFSADAALNGIVSHVTGFGQFSGNNLSSDSHIQMPISFALYANYPNPFNPTTLITYDLAEKANVSLVIYDLMGREVKTLVHMNQPSGKQIAIWDAQDNIGQPVSAGVYIYQLKAGKNIMTRKMVLMK